MPHPQNNGFGGKAGARAFDSELRLVAPPILPTDVTAGPGEEDGGGHWCFAGPAQTARQGWKLYISASNANFATTLLAIRPVLTAHGIGFKYVANERVLRKLNAGLYGYSQIGKTIVAYLKDGTIAAPLLAELKAVLRPFADSAIQPPFTEPIGGGLPLSYRYGAYRGDTIEIGTGEQPDNRSRRLTAEDGLPRDPFLSSREPPRSNDDFERLLLDYPVYEVLSQSAKGGVYAAMDLTSPEFREVVLKVGRRNGNVLPDGRDAMDLTRRESWFYGLATERGLGDCIAQLDRLAEFADRAVLIMERIEGESLLALHLRNALEMSYLSGAITILRRFHDAGLLVGDAKLANFMLTPVGTLKVIDFETGGLIAEAAVPDQHCTFLFTDPGLRHRPAALEMLHFLYSVVHTDDAASFDEASRVINLDAVLRAEQRSSIGAAALAMMRDVLDGTHDGIERSGNWH